MAGSAVRTQYKNIRYMMATKAFHQLGEISSDKPDLCLIEGEEGDSYIGRWATGFGFEDVKFPKETTRELSPAEKKHFNRRVLRRGSSGRIEHVIKIA